MLAARPSETREYMRAGPVAPLLRERSDRSRHCGIRDVDETARNLGGGELALAFCIDGRGDFLKLLTDYLDVKRQVLGRSKD